MDSNTMGLVITLSIFLFIALGAGLAIFFLLMNVNKDNLFTLVEKTIRMEKYKEAYRLLEKNRRKNRNNFYFSYYFAICNEKLDHYHPAIDYYEKSLIQLMNQPELSFMESEILLSLGKANYIIRDIKASIAYYSRYLIMHPKDIHVLFILASAYYETNRYTKAYEELERIFKINSKYPKALLLMGKVYFEMHEYPKSIGALKIFLKFSALSDAMIKEAYQVMAKAYTEMGSHMELVDIYSFLITDEKLQGSVLNPYVLALISVKQNDRAITVYREYYSAIDTPARCELLVQMGVEISRQGDIFHALDCWEEAFLINPDYKDLKDLITRYTVFVDYPELESYFDENTESFIKYICEALKYHKADIIVKNANFIIIEKIHTVAVLFRKAAPINMSWLTQIENAFAKEKISQENMTLYSLFGVDPACKNYIFFLKTDFVASEQFIRIFTKQPEETLSAVV